ncbi:ATP-binding protein [Photorhabdus laumondii]|uniref:Histidine kinase n=1 Tax=Photorhabdus laumondii subsp. clarkei TaxID=2029685 RepID=A0A329VDA6_9GAMM|nr:ATP-binding protein [Photorhabdus laumondii]RAW87481.1 histidine kinase [Photorhabdus laumondii subsp. clarkei]
MVNSVIFQTRARTIDHLGREQIADCPTAISELWKNAFDAYARKVELHIFDEKVPVAALVDDGHGMSREEFETKWLTVGTESKASKKEIPKEDMNGLSRRVKQGQKGIGRLSCAALGSLLLLISKRKDSPFVAALIDWRLFENPYLYLHDIRIPVIEFTKKEELYDLLPSLFNILVNNIIGDSNKDDESYDKHRNKRILDSWEKYEQQELSEGKTSTKSAVLNTVIHSVFTDDHLIRWSVWNGESDRGTVMLLSGLHDDLIAQLTASSIEDDDGPTRRARERFIQTLSNFTDPFLRDNEVDNNINFVTSVIAWRGHIRYPVIDEVREFDIHDLEELEHIVEGVVNEDGYFHGRVRAFGQWFENVIIKPKIAYKTRVDTKVGPFSIRLGTFEQQINSSTLSKEQHSNFKAWCEKYAGLRIYRDYLRVMPYGREDNDYFEIEKRRSYHAGRHFWSNRRLFGRILISRDNNPNLRDKAGREGLLDNKAAKIFKEIVEKILQDTADRFIGGESDIRMPIINDIRKRKEKEKVEEDKKKLIKKERRRIKEAINENFTKLKSLLNKLEEILEILSIKNNINDIDSATKIKEEISCMSSLLTTFSLSPVPKNLGSIDDKYREYRNVEIAAKDYIKRLDASINELLDKLVDKKDIDIALSVFRSKRAKIHSQIRKWSVHGRELLESELKKFNDLVDERNKAFDSSLSETLEDLHLNQLTLSQVLTKIDSEYEIIEVENRQHLLPYITALENIREQIDLEGLTIHSLNETTKLKEEVERLNGLAQLGITVEIIGHEIEGLDMTMERGLKVLRQSSFTDFQRKSYNEVVYAQKGLSERLRFLSPLKLSGEKIRKLISGDDIYQYINNFFGDSFERKGIIFSQTEQFSKFTIYDQPSRIYPVFINLINNARFWVCQGEEDKRKIILDIKNNEVFVADSGPGVELSDIDSLFTLFFSRKPRGGRGIGLYLCKVNLQASGHTIRYELNSENKILAGANFVILFKGVN